MGLAHIHLSKCSRVSWRGLCSRSTQRGRAHQTWTTGTECASKVATLISAERIRQWVRNTRLALATVPVNGETATNLSFPRNTVLVASWGLALPSRVTRSHPREPGPSVQRSSGFHVTLSLQEIIAS